MEDDSAIDKAYAEGKGAYARKELQSAEDDASGEQGSATSARAAEGGSAFKNSVTGNKASSIKKFQGKGKLKKTLPLIAILLAIIVAAGAIAFISQSFQLVSLLEQVKASDNKLSATVYTRIENDTISKLNSTDPADRLSDHLIDLFAKHGLDYIETDNGDGTVARALVYNGDSTSLIASASAKDAVLSALSATGSVIDSFQDLASLNNAEAILQATWFGTLSEDATAVHFDEDARLTYQRLGQNPGKLAADSDNPSKEDIISSIKQSHATGYMNQTSEKTYRYEWKVGLTSSASCASKAVIYKKDGTWHYDCWVLEEINNDDDINDQMPKDEMTTALTNRAIVAAFSSTPNPNMARGTTRLASVSDGGNSANKKSDNSVVSAVSAMVKDKTLDFAFSLANAVDKTKGGDGGSEMSYFGGLMNTPADSYDADGNLYSHMPAAASTSFNSWFSDDVKVDPNNKIVKKYNVEETMKAKGYTDATITSNGGDLKNNYNNIDTTSSVTRSTENMKNNDDDRIYYYCLEATEYPNGKEDCPGYGEIPESPYYVSDEAADYVYAMTSVDLISDPHGEEAAVAFNEGIQLLNSALLGQSSGTKGSAASVAKFYQMNQDYVAKLANYERVTRSPFDASSKYTFLGSIVGSLLPFATTTSSNSLFAAISSSFSVLSSSITSLTPSASAINTMDFMNAAVNGNCYSNDASEMVCDSTGNPITIMEMDHMDDDMSAVRSWMEANNYVTCETIDGKITCEPKDDDNEYAKWLLCTQNDTIVNINLSTEQQGNIGFWASIGRSILRFFGIPTTVKNQTSCGGNYNRDATTEEKFKYFAQFTLDMRILAVQQEATSISATFFNKYYEDHPIDNSYEGRIARLSGLTRDEVIAALDFMEYEVYLAHYHPETRYQFIAGLFEKDPITFDETNPNDPFAVAAVTARMSEYDELRNRVSRG